MKRILDIASAVLVVLALALGWRIVQVFGVTPPHFEDAAQTAQVEPLPPPPRSPTPRGASVDAIVDGDLFETERGAGADDGDGEVEPPQEDLPPPTNVVLNGVFFQLTGQPMAIMTDTSSGNRQLTLHEGDNLGEYQVGKITQQRVTLLGRNGQEFSLQLDISKSAGVAPARTAAAQRRTPPRPTPAASGARGAVPPRTPPAQPQTPAAQRVAQTAAQRAAEARRQQAGRAGRPAEATAPADQQRQDATAARLEALRRLREAARSR